MLSAPEGPIAQAAAAPQPVAAMAEAAGGGGGAAIDEDLQARLDNLRKT
jgi:hypothetical protein